MAPYPPFSPALSELVTWFKLTDKGGFTHRDDGSMRKIEAVKEPVYNGAPLVTFGPLGCGCERCQAEAVQRYAAERDKLELQQAQRGGHPGRGGAPQHDKRGEPSTVAPPEMEATNCSLCRWPIAAGEGHYITLRDGFGAARAARVCGGCDASGHSGGPLVIASLDTAIARTDDATELADLRARHAALHRLLAEVTAERDALRAEAKAQAERLKRLKPPYPGTAESDGAVLARAIAATAKNRS